MKIGVFAVLFGDKPFEETLDYLVELGVEAVEIGTGAYPGNAHCNPAALLASARRLKAFREAVSSRGLVISALSCHGNPLHPQARIARDHHNTFLKTVELARALNGLAERTVTAAALRSRPIRTIGSVGCGVAPVRRNRAAIRSLRMPP